MEEERRGIGQAVDAVEDAAVSGQEITRVLDPEIAFQRRDDDIADNAGLTAGGRTSRNAT